MADDAGTVKIALIAMTIVSLSAIVVNAPFWRADTPTAGTVAPQTLIASPQQVAPPAAPLAPQAVTPDPSVITPAIASLQSAPGPTPSAATISPPSDPGPRTLVARLRQPEVATQILGLLQKLQGIAVPAGEGARSAEHPIYALYDPRCPYCHDAYKHLLGKVDVVWLPTLALGRPEGNDGPDRLASFLVGPGREVVTDPITKLDTISGPETDSEAPARLHQVMMGETEDAEADPTDASLLAVQENEQLLQTIYRDDPGQLAVPTFLVPRADGGLERIRGFSPEYLQPMLDLYPGGSG